MGIDAGTGGIRASVIDQHANEILSNSIKLPIPDIKHGRCESEATHWLTAMHQLIQQLSEQLTDTGKICAIAIDGTSGTLLACDNEGSPLGKALMYNDQQSIEQAAMISRIAPPDCAAHGASASLAKALTLAQRYPEARHLCHQADWLSGSLTGCYAISDENNCLKTGYDIIRRCWPQWLEQLSFDISLLPEVLTPGDSISTVKPAMAARLVLPEDCKLIAGTTDSIAAFIATGASQAGDAVTSLGSTLVLKLLTEQAVFDAGSGIYSHRLGKHWLVGGASNSGGRVLQQFFSQQQLEQMTSQLHPEQPTGLNYYPLPGIGERFPINDSQKKPVLAPRPDSDSQFFQAILEGISRIEHQGYAKLAQLGAGKVKRIFSCGGGADNQAWSKIRQRELGLPIVTARHTEASYGSALLAMRGWKKTSTRNTIPNH